MYRIYHIKNLKVGCTKDIKNRVEVVQGIKKQDYEILAKTNSIIKASNLEMYYQVKLGYKQDKNTYLQMILNNQKTEEMVHITERTLTFKGTDDKLMTGYKFPGVIELNDGSVIEFTDEIIQWIKINNNCSQNNKERFVYINQLLNYINSLEALKTTEISVFKNIRSWAKDKGILDKGDTKTQYVKLQEEAGELAKALLNNDEEEIIDAIGDCVVVLTNLAKLAGYNIEDCIQSAYNVISKRTGEMKNGTFVKN